VRKGARILRARLTKLRSAADCLTDRFVAFAVAPPSPLSFIQSIGIDCRFAVLQPLLMSATDRKGGDRKGDRKSKGDKDVKVALKGKGKKKNDEGGLFENPVKLFNKWCVLSCLLCCCRSAVC
jgi:hypothetical protein